MGKAEVDFEISGGIFKEMATNCINIENRVDLLQKRIFKGHLKILKSGISSLKIIKSCFIF